MQGLLSTRQLILAFGLVCVALATGAPAQAQSTGIIRGRVVDVEGKPVEDATVSFEFMGGVTRRLETDTNARGEFVQIGLQPGQYKVTAAKEKVGEQSFEVRVRAGQPLEINFALAPPAGPALGEELQRIFGEGVALSKAGKHTEAIAKFTEALGIAEQCFDCHYNIGIAYAQMKEYDKAEAAFKQALTVKPDYGAAYGGLANIYNAQKKFDQAAAASAEAAKLGGAGGAAGGNVDAIFNQGVIYWNAGKIADAKKQFEETVAADPNHAEAHYWLGMAHVNEGRLAEAVTEFELYLKLAPTGQYAAQAQGIVTQLKK